MVLEFAQHTRAYFHYVQLCGIFCRSHSRGRRSQSLSYHTKVVHTWNRFLPRSNRTELVHSQTLPCIHACLWIKIKKYRRGHTTGCDHSRHFRMKSWVLESWRTVLFGKLWFFVMPKRRGRHKTWEQQFPESPRPRFNVNDETVLIKSGKEYSLSRIETIASLSPTKVKP